ncbi:hypothetical protein [Qipengyuania marisflavi]|uniref:Uncharacterized protein n=1 Tax=Qipengyuania marisflavi TaxID=2486356 RepID=A0A5S3P865_9SPHN|nr:hypothetical protein [Qipengyuania marisflavi]TMM49694.1 hypothetical protein FEV51_00335 [Qipengyuania marisflavi]
MIFVKLFLAAVFALIGLWLWRMANRWSMDGEIPKEWVKSIDPQPVARDDTHFGKVVAWQKLMALMAWFFAGLFVLSIGFELTGNL